MTISINESYILYGKMGKMKRMKPVYKDRFVSNLIHAEILTPKTLEDIVKMEREVRFLQGQGQFELRKIN